MKKRISLIIFLFLTTNIFAQQTPTQPKYISPNHRSWFNKVTDSMATVGKPKSEKERIIRMRKEDRRYLRQRKEEYQRNKKASKKMQKQSDAILNKIPKGRTTIGL